ncbi:hypothetical protein [Bradyrhizobium diazoefficiens]|uniref:hypothetical protein n=1 Tax=Bradyrhizobium diazoefficiens TaxID=1355477 RepID=UPI00272BBC2C|nr:hypothetical protein [Bradyrhizobium diazoefficiens]WLA58522.1 hypothetical protein QIH81_07635 [Bradyrhizobium diazoefficiens]
MAPKYVLRSKHFRPADVAKIAGFTPGAQRDLKRRGYNFGEDSDGWLNATAHDIAKLLLVKTLREAGIELAEAWRQADPEIVGNLLLHAVLQPHAIDLHTDGQDAPKINPSILNKWAMDFAAAHTEDRSHVAGGSYIVFGPTIPAGLYGSIEHALEIASKKHNGPHLVGHVVMMRELSKLLAQRAGQLAYIERA